MRGSVIKFVRALFVHLPISLLAGSVFLAPVGAYLASGELRIAGLWLLRAGPPLGVVAAISTIMDGILAVPRSRREAATATRCVNLGVAAFLLFSVALISRGSLGGAPSSYTLALEAFGTLVLTAAAIRWRHGCEPAAKVLVFRPVR